MKGLIISIVLFACSLIVIPINCAAFETEVASGAYRLPLLDSRPLFLTSENSGKNWSFVEDKQVQLPPSSQGGIIFTSSCTGNVCIAPGDDYNDLALLLMSTDQGHSWSYVKNISGLPTMPLGWLTSSSCMGSVCVGIGDNFNDNTGDGKASPLIITSHDKGQSWTSVQSITNLPNNYQGENLNAVSCTNNSCVAAGNYWHKIHQGDLFPLLLTSMDKGQTWSFVPNINGLPDTQQTFLQTVSCSSSICAVPGSLDDIKDGYLYEKPLLIVGGGDSNKPWILVKDISGFPVLTGGVLYSATYNGNNWIVGGYYYNDNTHAYPLLLWSNDAGKNWTTSQNISGSPETPVSFIMGTYCDSTICFATGKYNTGKIGDYSIFAPLILISKDSGHNWSYVKNISGLPIGMFDAYPMSSKCIGSICTIVGDYYYNKDNNPNNNDNYDYPLLLVSTDNGQSWTFIPDNTISNMPPIDYGYIFNVAGSDQSSVVSSSFSSDSNGRKSNLFKKYSDSVQVFPHMMLRNPLISQNKISH